MDEIGCGPVRSVDLRGEGGLGGQLLLNLHEQRAQETVEVTITETLGCMCI